MSFCSFPPPTIGEPIHRPPELLVVLGLSSPLLESGSRPPKWISGFLECHTQFMQLPQRTMLRTSTTSHAYNRVPMFALLAALNIICWVCSKCVSGNISRIQYKGNKGRNNYPHHCPMSLNLVSNCPTPLICFCRVCATIGHPTLMFQTSF